MIVLVNNLYACLSTRPDIWCEVAGIAYSVKVGPFTPYHNYHDYEIPICKKRSHPRRTRNYNL